MKIVLITSIVLFAANVYLKAQTDNSFSQNTKYNIEILYEQTFNNSQAECFNDSLPLVFESYFLNDIIEVYKNGNILLVDTITSDLITGHSKILLMENYKTIETIGIRMNTGSMALIETNKNCYYLRVIFDDLSKTLRIIVYTKKLDSLN